jgi:hypothetical protein
LLQSARSSYAFTCCSSSSDSAFGTMERCRRGVTSAAAARAVPVRRRAQRPVGCPTLTFGCGCAESLGAPWRTPPDAAGRRCTTRCATRLSAATPRWGALVTSTHGRAHGRAHGRTAAGAGRSHDPRQVSSRRASARRR